MFHAGMFGALDKNLYFPIKYISHQEIQYIQKQAPKTNKENFNQ